MTSPMESMREAIISVQDLDKKITHLERLHDLTRGEMERLRSFRAARLIILAEISTLADTVALKSESRFSREPDTAPTSIGSFSSEKRQTQVAQGTETVFTPIMLAMLRAVGGSITLSLEEREAAYQAHRAQVEMYEIMETRAIVIREVTDENKDGNSSAR